MKNWVKILFNKSCFVQYLTCVYLWSHKKYVHIFVIVFHLIRGGMTAKGVVCCIECFASILLLVPIFFATQCSPCLSFFFLMDGFSFVFSLLRHATFSLIKFYSKSVEMLFFIYKTVAKMPMPKHEFRINETEKASEMSHQSPFACLVRIFVDLEKMRAYTEIGNAGQKK